MFRRSWLVKTIALSMLILLSRGAIAAIGSGPAVPSPSPAKFGPQMPSSGATAPVAASTPVVLTYQAWKSVRVDEARLVLERMTFEAQVEKMPVIERSPVEKAVIRPAVAQRAPQKGGRADSRIDNRIEQARMNLEIAEDLTVNDYLIIYLSQFKSRDVILDVARRMAPEDVADLLMSYQKLSSSGQIAEHSLPATPRLSPRPL